MRRTEQTLKEYIENRVDRTASGCWLWMHALNDDGYGIFRITGTRRNERVHRAAYREWIDDLPDGACVLHLCDVPACCNPAHLFLGTKKDNMSDCSVKGRTRNQKKTHCFNGHEYTSDNTYFRKNGKVRRCKACCKKWGAEQWQRKKLLRLNAL